MPDRQRIYHPETGEPFDLPVAKANHLRLEKGWLAQPLDPDAVPLVQTVGKHQEPVTSDEEEDWSVFDEGDEDDNLDESVDQ